MAATNFTTKDIVYAVCAVSTDLLNVVGHSTILILIYMENRARTATSKLLINQTLADGTVGVVYLFATMYLAIYNPDEKDVNSKLTIVRVCLVALYSESLQTLGMIAFSLYIAICHPLTYRFCKKSTMVAVFVITTWTLNIVVALLILVADGAFTNSDYTMFSFYRLNDKSVWYEILKLLVMFLPPLFGVACCIRVWIHKRNVDQDALQAQSSTKKLVSQAFGILLMSSAYVIAFMIQIIGENLYPHNKDSNNASPIVSFIVYIYLAGKLPIFLLVFKPYRQVARDCCCPCRNNRIQPLSAETGSLQVQGAEPTVPNPSRTTLNNNRHLKPTQEPDATSHTVLG
ncbi:kappa-type opioid receptor-like [Haliotis cracherodii]|uniref:kappa-type opioid receptor-like n=1 Tax=Haliotis cracherodii TaxID=6455 RepID=UPI0039ED3838